MSQTQNIAVVGLSGRFPESENVSEFMDNLFGKVDMLTTDDRRWPAGALGIPERHGQLKDIEGLDANFFRIHGGQASKMDPQLRLLLETTFEALNDGGLSPAELKGTNTGVFVGGCFSDMHDYTLRNADEVLGYENTGCAHSMFSNRLSFAFDWHGPSFTVDTACSSSLVAMVSACKALKDGDCDFALVGGTSVTLRPEANLAFDRLHMLSPDGACKSFDTSANGYARSEAVGVVILARPDALERIQCRKPYAYLRAFGCNNDGFTTQGITFPNVDAQIALNTQVCKASGLDPSEIDYVEAHGTGTTAGDGVELKALDTVYGLAHTPEKPLLLGSVKSNMGHSEGAAAIVSFIKVCAAFDRGELPPNLHYNNPNSSTTDCLITGRVKVVDEPTPFTGKYAAISSFGFGGTNAHVILERGESSETRFEEQLQLPQWLQDNLKLAFGRTEDGAAKLLNVLQQHADAPTLVGPPVLSTEAEWVHDMYPIRASSVQGSVETNSMEGAPQRPVWFVFTGNGGMWVGMGRELYATSETFRATIDEAVAVAEEVNCDLKKIMFQHNLAEDQITPAEAMMCQVAIQIALVRLWKEIGVEPEGFLGHSAGEIPAGYLDGALTLRQAILVAYWRNEVIARATLDKGSMYAVGLSREEAEKAIDGLDLCCVGCVNDPSGMTLSGASAQLDPVAEKLSAAGIFCRHVNTKGIAHHSPMLAPLHDDLVRELEAVIPTPAARSSRWISTCCIEGRSADDEIAKTCSPKYVARNFVSAVEFVAAMAYLPQNAIAIEIGPHALLASPIRRTRPDLLYIPTMKKGMDSMQTVAASVAHAFRVGALDHLIMQVVASPVAKQVNDRKLREALVSWDHSMHFPVPKFLEIQASSNRSGAEIKYDIQGEHHFLLEHVIDGKPLMPAASYVYAVWQGYANEVRKSVHEVGIRLKNFVIHQAIPINEQTDEVKLRVSFGAPKGGFRAVEVTRDGELICSGAVAGVHDAAPIVDDGEVKVDNLESFSQTAFYTAIKKHGYDYAPLFRPVHSIRRDGLTAVMQWIPESHYVSFIDGLLQCLLNPMSSKAPLLVPTTLSSVTLHPLGGNRDVARQTPVTIEPWRNAAFTAWGEITGVQMKPLKRNKTDAVASISQEVWVPIGQSFIVDKDPRSDERCAYGNQQIAHQIKTILQHFESSENPAVATAKGFVQKQADFLSKYGEGPAASDETAMMEVLREVAASIDSSTTLESLGAAIRSNKRWADALKSDLLWGYNLWLEPLFEVVEQTVGDEMTICEINAGASSFSEILVHKTTVDAIKAVCATEEDAEAVNSALGSLGTVETVQWDVSKTAPSSLAEKFQVVVVRNSAVATNGQLESLSNIVSTVAPGGFLLLLEPAGLLPCLTVGLGLTGTGLGPAQWLTPESWNEVCDKVGLNNVIHAVSEDGHQQALLLRKPFKEALNSTVLDSCANVLENEAGFAKWKQDVLAAEGAADRVVLQAQTCSGMVGTFRCLIKERHLKLRLRLTDGAESKESSADGFDLGIVRRMSDGSSATPVHLPFVPVMKTEPTGAANSVRKGVYLKFEVEGDLNSARWYVNDQQPGSDEVVDVHAAALNFKDVMLAYGKIDQSAFYGRPKMPRSVGFEFAGILRSSGKRVMGMADDAIATVVHVPLKNTWEVPANWTLENAATVPVVYATAYHALVVRARLRAGMSVLIHAGTGGVGQAAIRIALERGCRVFTTCSSDTKRQFLLSTFPGLSNEQILNSRSANFEAEVMRQTNGKGVNVVLNSLADEKLQASIRCVAQHGHFCEIGKFDIMEHTAIDMHALVRNITIHGIDVDQIQFDEFLWQETYDLVKVGIESGEVVPLPVSVYDADDVVEMFRFMAEGKHIGKVVLRLDNEETVARIEKNARQALVATGNETYVISGGLGGFGLAMAQWFAEKGVKHIVLSSRSGVRSGDQQNAIDKIRAAGSEVTVATANLTDEAAVGQMLTEAEQVAPVVAVFHLAMVLEDSRFENMTPESWSRVLAPKVAGTVVLDNMTRKHCPHLQHFVTFSSIAAGMGNGGQTNYAYGNSFMDRIAEERVKAGFPGLSLQWGVIGDVGVAAKTLDDRFLKDVVRPQSLDSCLEVLENSMNARTQGVVMSYVPSKKTADEGAGAKDVVAAVLSVLRLPVNATKRTATLDALGMDSMQSVEVQTIVRRIKGKAVPVDELQKMTLDQIDAL